VRSSSRPCGYFGLARSVAQEKSRTEKTAKKTPVVPRGTLCRDGCLKMSNNAAERIRAIALGRKIFLLVPTPGTACGDHLHPHRECRRRRSSRSREARPKTIMAIGSLFHFACQIPRTRKPLRTGAADKQTYAVVEERGGVSPPLGTPRKFRSAPKPLLPERSSRAVLSGALRACFLGAGLLLAGM
jgi:hypothetical protein